MGRALLVSLALVACSESRVTEKDVLCDGDFGVGMRVEGRSSPLEVCVSDADVSALLTAASRYDVAAQMQTDDGVYQVRMVFAKRADFPVTLRIVDTIAETTNDPDAVWIHYEEIPDGGKPVESGAATGGKFRLSFSDDKVAAGYFERVGLQMQEVLTGDPAGSRVIVRGEFSVSNKSGASPSVSLR